MTQKTYICTSSAVRAGQCKQSELGQFIVSSPEDDSSTTIFTSALRFGDGSDMPAYGSEPSDGEGDNDGGYSEPSDSIPTVPDYQTGESSGQGEGEGFDESFKGFGNGGGTAQGDANEYVDDDGDAPARAPEFSYDGDVQVQGDDNVEGAGEGGLNNEAIEPLEGVDSVLPGDQFGNPFKLRVKKRHVQTLNRGIERRKRQFDVVDGITGGMSQGGAFGEPAVGVDQGEAPGQQSGDQGDGQSEGEGDEEHRDDDDEGEKDDEEEHHDDDDEEHHDDEEDEDEHEDDHKHTWVEPGTSAEGVQQYTQPLRYPVKKTGYYCVGMSTLHFSLLPGLERVEI